ncbi:hypothetical protein FEM48_Zijuj08G0073900 [Ziziphus jujuba var. spinosa]|uniref:Isopenicillin N synthase-like Fe(2+) 2OG dioxygenase domain-containing protein n=1 Tax=Ziziphus jujuba var. spinosa TaxID=714518 RepID=A0A978UXR8_ZIZJJ|nr:hypothetical protein FEM48_Zijuj08G0073900 [Ziziphus jujuba var. spinosa]
MADDHKESGMSVSSIPMIDLQKFGDEEDDEEEEYKKLREACEEWVCFRKTIEKYVEAMNEVCMDIGRKIAKRVGLVDVELFDDLPWGFRMNKYYFTPEFVGSTGANTHSGSGYFTRLQDDEIVSGLQVMNKCGQFVAVNPWPGTLPVSLGDVAAAHIN